MARKGMKRALEDAALVLDPKEADLRVVEPEEIHIPPPAQRTSRKRAPLPEGAEVHPSPKELGKEHRGY